MFRYFIRVIALLYSLTFFQQAFAETVKVDVKEHDNQTTIVFYHDKRNPIAPSVAGSFGRVRAHKSIKMQVISRNLQTFCSSIKLDQARSTIDFKLRDNYRFAGNIYGENLVGFNIRDVNKTYPKNEDSPPPKVVKEVAEAKATTEVAPTKSAEIGLKKSDVTVQVIDTKASKNLIFPFNDKDTGAAVFMRGTDLWIVFDSRRDFFIPNASFIESWSQLTDPKNTILKISLKNNLAITATKQRNNWALSLASKQVAPKASIQPVLVSDILVSVRQVGKMKNIVTVRDSAVGDVLMMVPLPDPGMGVDKEKSMVDYKILSSSQGLAISLISDDVKITYNKNTQDLDISSRYTMPSEKEIKPSPKDTRTILPPRLYNGAEANFLEDRRALYGDIVDQIDASSTAVGELELGKFYFGHQLYHEALGSLRNAEYHDPKSFGMAGLLTKAASLIMTNQALDARLVFADLKNRYRNDDHIFEIELWDKYNEYLLGNIPTENIGVSGNKIIESYPDHLYWEFVFAELDTLAAKKDAKSMDALFNNLRASNDISTNNHIKFYRGKYFCLLSQINLCQKSFEDVQKNAQNGKEYMMSSLQLIKLLYDQKVLDWANAIHKLNDLRFVWRGDRLEMQLLLAMGMAYKQNNDLMGAIRTYKYIIDAFGRQTENTFFVTSQIVELYNRIFLSDESKGFDDFNTVALFYEFKDFTPIGLDGDKVVLSIARRMLNLDLLEMASTLLEHQVMYRLRGTERMVTANHLALVLLMDKKPIDALKVLDDTDKENFGYTEHQKRRYLKAKALIDMEKYNEALSYISDSVDEDAVLLRSEVLFRGGKWAEYVKFVEPIIKGKMQVGDVIEGSETQDALRLALSYSMLNQTADIEYLQKHIITESTELKSIIEFLRSSNTPINPRNLDKSLNIDQMQIFLDNYKKKLFDGVSDNAIVPPAA